VEVEAKFVVPDVETFQRLQATEHLGVFALLGGETKRVRDIYLDTAERAILVSGYTCRQRIQDDLILITLKRLRGSEGAIHRREELEVSLLSEQPPAHWPESPARGLVLQLIGDSALIPLFNLQQTRLVRPVRRGERMVAEFSLDQVHLLADEQQQTYSELEVELTPEGTEDDLCALVDVLQDEWGLTAQTRSKFERGLAFLEEAHLTEKLLTRQERAVCLQIANRDDLHGRRARGLLALDEGATQAQAAQRAGMSSRRIRYWLAALRHKRLGVFPPRVIGAESRFIAIATETIAEKKPPPKVRAHVVEAPVLRLPTRPGLTADDSMAEAARKTLSFHLQRMLYHEPGARAGEDTEELHDMRVATRRMRAALKVFLDYLDMDQMKPFVKGLRDAGRTLGAVRDLDVFWQKTQHYLDTLPPSHQEDLAPLHAVWKVEREKARERMLAYLDGDRYARFKGRFGEFLQSPDAGALPTIVARGYPPPQRLRHMVPVLVYQRVAVVRVYDGWITEPHVPLQRFHRLRIDTKALRYTLEFFREVLDKKAKPLIEEITSLQDHLGSLQDAVVASNLLRDFLTWGTWGHALKRERRVSLLAEPIVAPGVASYLAARQTEIQRLVETFPQVWAHIQSPEFSRQVAAALATL